MCVLTHKTPHLTISEYHCITQKYTEYLKTDLIQSHNCEGSESFIHSPDICGAQWQTSKYPYSHPPPVNAHKQSWAEHYKTQAFSSVWSNLHSLRYCFHLLFCMVCENIRQHLVSFQMSSVSGQPLHQISGCHISRSTGKRWVCRTRVLQLLPFTNTINGPILPETDENIQKLKHKIISEKMYLHYRFMFVFNIQQTL